MILRSLLYKYYSKASLFIQVHTLLNSASAEVYLVLYHILD